jgi:hypothetical protein
VAGAGPVQLQSGQTNRYSEEMQCISSPHSVIWPDQTALCSDMSRHVQLSYVLIPQCMPSCLTAEDVIAHSDPAAVQSATAAHPLQALPEPAFRLRSAYMLWWRLFVTQVGHLGWAARFNKHRPADRATPDAAMPPAVCYGLDKA